MISVAPEDQEDLTEGILTDGIVIMQCNGS
jgi:hypothetical protein